jgi:hypothetical protein
MTRVRVLFLASNPFEQTRLALDEEVRAITAQLRSADHRDAFELTSGWAVRPDDLQQLLLQYKPHVVHFSGHGTRDVRDERIPPNPLAPGRDMAISDVGQRELFVLMGDGGQPQPVSTAALVDLFHVLRDNVRLVLFNACHSESIAEAVAGVVPCTIGMSGVISDAAAIQFVGTFYRALGFGRSIRDSFDLGKNALMNLPVQEDRTPRLYSGTGARDPARVVLVEFPEPGAPVPATWRSGQCLSGEVATPIDYLPRPPMTSPPIESPKNRRPARKFSLMISGWGFKLTLSISGSILLMASVYYLNRDSRSKDGAGTIGVDKPFSGPTAPNPPAISRMEDDRKAESPVPEALKNLLAQREDKAAEVERARSRQIQALQNESRLHQLFSRRSASSAAEFDRALAERTIADAELELATAELRELDRRLKQENDRKQEKPAGRSPVIEARNRVELLSCRRDARAAEVKKAEAQSEFTLRSLRRVERLEKLAAVPKEDLEKASDAHRIAEAELAAKKSRLEEAESQLAQARNQLRTSESSAP